MDSSSSSSVLSNLNDTVMQGDDSVAENDAANEMSDEEAQAREQAEQERKDRLEREKEVYTKRANARLAAFMQPGPSYSVDSDTPTTTSSTSYYYSFTPVFNIPQTGVQTNTLVASPCSSHIFSGASDGYIRRYAWYASLRRRETAPSSSPVLAGYWENPSISSMEALSLGDVTKARFGPASITGTVAGAVAVHSLVVQKEELFALAGSAEGVINLFGVRIDEGQVRASLGMTGKGHTRGKPLSALALTHSERGLLSGGWDAQVLEWSLDDGQCIREFVGHTSQIVAIQFRPEGAQPIVYSSEDVLPSSPTQEAPEDNQKADATKSAETIKNAVPTIETSKDGEKDDDLASETSYDPLFDDEGDAASNAAQLERTLGGSPAQGGTPSGDFSLSLPGMNLSSVLQLGSTSDLSAPSVNTPSAPPPKTKLPANNKPKIASWRDASLPELSNDVFISLSIDGECLLWDRGAPAGSANVRRLDVLKGTPLWSTSCAWSPSGNVVYIGRRNATVDVYDLLTRRAISIRLPTNSKQVTSVLPMKNGVHLLIGSNDAIRLYNLETGKFGIVAAQTGGATTLRTDARDLYLFATFGGRGWLENGKEEVATFEIKKSPSTQS